MKKRIMSASAAETAQAAEMLALALEKQGKKSAFVALYGDMGVGKTAFAAGFCRALGITGAHSPTYTVINEYRAGRIPVFHLDLYRLEGEDDLCSIGFDDYLEREGYLLCEWSERLEGALPEGALTVCIEKTEQEDGRRILMDVPDGLL